MFLMKRLFYKPKFNIIFFLISCSNETNENPFLNFFQTLHIYNFKNIKSSKLSLYQNMANMSTSIMTRFVDIYAIKMIIWSCNWYRQVIFSNSHIFYYYMFGWKSKMKLHIFHPILWMDPWMDENLVVFAMGHSCFGN